MSRPCGGVRLGCQCFAIFPTTLSQLICLISLSRLCFSFANPHPACSYTLFCHLHPATARSRRTTSTVADSSAFNFFQNRIQQQQPVSTMQATTSANAHKRGAQGCVCVCVCLSVLCCVCVSNCLSVLCCVCVYVCLLHKVSHTNTLLLPPCAQPPPPNCSFCCNSKFVFLRVSLGRWVATTKDRWLCGL